MYNSYCYFALIISKQLVFFVLFCIKSVSLLTLFRMTITFLLLLPLENDKFF
jgi:hypothetical protein